MLRVLAEWFDEDGDPDFTVIAEGLDATCTQVVARALPIILLNLTDNAKKCAGAGGGVILSCRRSAGQLVISVENSGLVMPATFASYLRGDTSAVPNCGNRECEGLQTVRHTCQEANIPLPSVDAPASSGGDGTRISLSIPVSMTTKEERS